MLKFAGINQGSKFGIDSGQILQSKTEHGFYHDMIIPESISAKLDSGNNSFGLVRLIAASAVVFSHAWSVTAGNDALEPLEAETGFALGWHAVNLFFALSGLLIAGSLSRSKSILSFAWARVLRIFPALMTVTIITISLAALIVDTTTWKFTTVVEFLLRNIFLIGATATLPGVFQNNPVIGDINIPIWTLKYEVFAYFSIVILTIFCRRFSSHLRIQTTTLVILVMTALIMLFFGPSDTHGRFEHLIRLLFAFYLGVAAWHWRELKFLSGLVFVLLSVMNFGLLWLDVSYAAIQIIWLVYAGLLFGIRTYGWASAAADKQDYSYGIYIIGYPIQQIVMAYTGITDPWLNFVVSLLLVLPLAACSWNFIEKPALKLKKLYL